ncbi:hypothetical protein ABIE83_002079 [Bradyrhizobium diazoefficiens]
MPATIAASTSFSARAVLSISGEHVLLGPRGAVDLRDEVARDQVEYGLEHCLLGLEVMVDRALSDVGRLRNLVHRGGGKALRPEQAARRRQDRLRCRRPPLRLFRHVVSSIAR